MPRWTLLAVLPLCFSQVRSMVEISGVVVDAQGAPIPDVWIAHAGVDFKTRADGTFRLSTNAPAVVFRHQSFTSEFRRTANLRNVEIRMTLFRPMPFPACRGHRFAEPVNPLRILFRIPKVQGITALPAVVDVDYMIRFYRLDSNLAAKMEHRHGVMGAQTVPPDDAIWELDAYEEIAREAGGLTVIDARGVTANGKRWRSLRKMWETITYSNLPSEEAALFDRAIDGVCGVN